MAVAVLSPAIGAAARFGGSPVPLVVPEASALCTSTPNDIAKAYPGGHSNVTCFTFHRESGTVRFPDESDSRRFREGRAHQG